MSTDLSPENELFLSRLVETGTFASRRQALDESVALLRKRNELVERIAEGRRQLDAGEFVEFDDASLEEYFGRLKQRANGNITP
ncbi:MAG: hypothetical protein KF851_11190 [Pirellulaceae bacterium]|nr:hypothetical protein [Pirellulaceae bacterium]